MNQELARWNNFKKLGLNASSKFVWVVSGIFSLMGFIGLLTTRTVEQAALPQWLFYLFVVIGIGLSIVVNMLELALNSENIGKAFNLDMEVMDVVLWVGGLVAYAYDIYTNILGLSLLMLGTIDVKAVPVQSLIFVIAWGVLLAILPEPMYVKSLKMAYVQAYKQPKAHSQSPYTVTPNTGGDSKVDAYLRQKYPDKFK